MPDGRGELQWGASQVTGGTDERLRAAVTERLARERLPAKIEVSVAAGEVTLEGAVRDGKMKYRVQSTAASVPGISRLVSRLRVGA